MQVRIISIRVDDCYIVSKIYDLREQEVNLTNILKLMDNETVFDEFLVIDSSLNETRIFNRKKEVKDEEEE